MPANFFQGPCFSAVTKKPENSSIIPEPEKDPVRTSENEGGVIFRSLADIGTCSDDMTVISFVMTQFRAKRASVISRPGTPL